MPNSRIYSLPWPPSMNHYWRRSGRMMHISSEGKAYRRDVIIELNGQCVTKMKGRLDVWILVFPGDRRKRDLDNLLKPLLDALQHGGAFEDDEQIDRLCIERGDVQPEACVEVTIAERSEQ